MRNFFWLFGFLMFWLLASSASAQISPGKLSRFHESLEGLTNCTKCHVLGEEVANSKCLDCHTAVQSRITAGSGYHSSSEVKDGKCASCHSEHNGRDFELVHWPSSKQSFDHSTTGFVLEGAHHGKDCSACHRGSFIADDAVKGTKSTNISRTMLGLSRQCISCHENEHQGQLAENCRKCHTFESWKPASGFSHAQTRYPLTGKHATVDCEKCHASQAAPAASTGKLAKKDHVGSFAQYKNLSFSNCTPCHADKHQGKFGADCQKCHVTSSFQTIAGNAFDHSKTRYPLRGLHRAVACQKCHTSGDMTKQLAFANCTNCHKDEHGGQFASRADKGACNACHTEDGYVPTIYGPVEHEKSRFALTGSHLAVPCSQCHTKAAETTPAKFRFDNLSCRGCHKDSHAGQLDIWINKGGCEFCHSTDTWHRTSFDHKLARFALEGRHREVVCLKCHKVTKQGEQELVWMKPLSMECASCHKDPHQAQFVRAEDGERQADCKRCHTAQNWKALSFDHRTASRFKLDGAHDKVACAACHPAAHAADGASYIVYRPLKTECSACHAGKRAS